MTHITSDSEALAEGQQVITACAFIHQQFDGVEKVFLPKRAATKKFLPGVYELPGGHIEFGEDIVDGLKREITEELGVSVAVGNPFAAFTYTNKVRGSHSIEVVYFVRLEDAPDTVTLNPEDHSAYGWFAESELGQVYSDQKGSDDDEFRTVRKGFALLQGEPLAF